MRVQARACPECRQGKHDNCDGEAWDDELDAPVACECSRNEHFNVTLGNLKVRDS